MDNSEKENKNVNLEPEIWTNDTPGAVRDQANDDIPDIVYNDDEIYEAILSNDIEKFCELVCNDEIDEAAAMEIFIAARRDLEIDDSSDEEIDGDVAEALTIAQRRARGRVMKRMKSRLKVARRIASRRRANPEKLKARALKQARLTIKKRLSAQRNYNDLSPSEKVAVDKRMERVSKTAVDRIARKLLPQVRKKETERMASRAAPAAQKNEDTEREIHTAYDLAESTILALQEKGVCEFITPSQMKTFEKVVDQLFAKFKIDFNFTKHFGERMSDKRNDPCISLEDLAGFIKKIYASIKDGKKSLSTYKDVEVVLKDLQQELNIPVAIEYDRKNDELDVIMKTIMRKRDFKTPNKVVKF